MKYLSELKTEDLAGKKVLLRVNLDVPFDEVTKKIGERFRIEAHRETVKYLLEAGAKILLVSHSSEVESFLPLVEEVGETLGEIVTLVPHNELSEVHKLFEAGPLLLLDNIRQDLREEENDEGLALSLSKGFDYYINDDFATCHRAHASIVAITKILPSYAGFLIKKEIEHLNVALEAPAEGKILVLGGAKISTKLPVIENFLNKCERILVGGALANNFFKAQGVKVGASVVDVTVPVPILFGVESIHADIVLPIDILVTDDRSGQGKNETKPPGNITDSQLIADIGPKSAQQFAEIIVGAKLVIWNGPMGLCEIEQFASGTKMVAEAVAKAEKSIIGGGDTIAATDALSLLSKFTFVSTGGGAMLEYLAGEELPGLVALGYNK
ncbi:MAG: phosphoglycerate kinase [Candidatus Yanofskybacteria bacterium RIFCSPLOWO2_02_FULL_45_10]|uniref:Phosphoglycerate kinase n=2 Tax=Candidatus Yanofskyibacteriota TaxID=1752733 RepID=A0A1F8G1Y9_9BACT|nr:MAG: phosphoglycerate kinase [Candidatus Yanofskybacteria bacterium RIFCSPHIGHO2_12_FULL_45_19b]OGN31541.1 MAG: phosphoglycerate kinase [Candidatus Yanofskybacteria bacterium RIFCSPLOWO2_02_FULL_45_10]